MARSPILAPVNTWLKVVGIWLVHLSQITTHLHPTTLPPYPTAFVETIGDYMHHNVQIGELYTHRHYEQVFLVHRCVNGWVYTTNVTLGKDKSIPLPVFLGYWRTLNTQEDT